MNNKKKMFIGIAGVGLLGLVGTGVGVGLNANKAVEVKAANTRIYCKCTQSWWTTGGAAIGIYAYKGETKNAEWPGVRMTPVATDTGVWYADIDTSLYDNVIFTRVNGGSGAVSDYGAKTADLTFDGNLYTITSTSAVWGDPGVAGSWTSGKYSEVADDLSLTFYASSADYTVNVNTKAYVWGDCVTSPEAGDFPGVAMTPTSKAVSFQGSTLYKQTISYESHMSDRSDVSINMILSNDGDKNKTEDITVIQDGHYYHPTDNHKWYNGYSADETLGAAAAVAFELDKNICSLAPSVADGLRDDMETYQTQLASATWDGYTYEEVYKLVDSQCTTPKLAGVSLNPISENGSNSSMLIAAVASVVSLLTLGGFFAFRKMKEN